MSRNFKGKLWCFVLKGALFISKYSANTTCPVMFHQPKLPNEVKRLRKF